jgi:mannose/fructose/N-acetylgalactosamine-specific phosphotransferase system component IIC
MMAEKKPYIIMHKRQFFTSLIVGFVILIIGAIYINYNLSIGAGILGFGFAICLLLLEQKINSAGQIK